MKEKGIRMQSAPTMRTSYIGFNMDDPVVGKNKKLRQAMAAAFNSDAWETYYKGRVVRARGTLPPGVVVLGVSVSLYCNDKGGASPICRSGTPGQIRRLLVPAQGSQR